MKKFLKSSCLGIIGIIVTGIIIGVAGGDKSTEKTATAQKQEDSKKEGESSNVKISVWNVKTTDSVGNEYSKETAQGVFKIVELSIENNQKDAITVDSNSFKLVDNKGREFSYSTHGQTAYELS